MKDDVIKKADPLDLGLVFICGLWIVISVLTIISVLCIDAKELTSVQVYQKLGYLLQMNTFAWGSIALVISMVKGYHMLLQEINS